jgi:hypothetical protein
MTSAITAAVLFVASTAFSVIQQQKAKRAAKKASKAAAAAEDARKGFEISVEGEIKALPILYGRGKVGGVRVYHGTTSNYLDGVVNSDVQFNAGTLAGAMKDRSTPPVFGQPRNIALEKPGARNEYLYYEQAICKRELSAVYDIIIDDNRKITDPEFTSTEYPCGLRVDVYYGQTPTSCNIIAANFANRGRAQFPGGAHLTGVFKLNRDDPQFGDTPSVSVLAEGVKIRKVVNGLLQTTKEYDNNSSWVLLDYLIEEKKVPIENILLDTFEDAAAVCATIVRSAPVGGAIWSARGITTRDIPLYEANLLLDTSKPHRENIETILETMGDARLVWSQGMYKLVLQYPSSNENIILADYITEDRIALGESIKIGWPTADQRYNYVNVKFSNEFNEFKDDTVSWPPKSSGSYFTGIGGVYYDQVSGWDSFDAGRFINNYGVWSSGLGTRTFAWKIRTYVTGTYQLSAVIDTTGSISINGASISESNTDWSTKAVKTISVYLNANTVYTISGSASADTAGRNGFAGTLTGPDNVQLWSSREAAYTDFDQTVVDDAVYLQILGEDNNIPLESDIYVDGITDPYHALAKAEELVRTSRSASNISLSYVLADKYPEPGDIIQVSIKDIALGIEGPLYVKIDTIKILGDGIVTIEGTRFDYTQLAWNVDDNVYAKPNPVWNPVIPAPMYLEYVAGDSAIVDAPGYLRWPVVFDTRVQDYVLYMKAELDELWQQIGTAIQGRFDLPNLAAASLMFGVCSRISTGSKSTMTVTALVDLKRAIPPAPEDITLSLFGDNSASVKITWSVPQLRPDGSVYSNHMLTCVYYSLVNDFALAQKVADDYDDTAFIHTPSQYGILHYWLLNVSWAGVKSEVAYCGSIEVVFSDTFTDSFLPPAPFDLIATGAFSSVLLEWTNPQYTEGGGHLKSIIYAAEWPLEQEIEPNVSSAKIIGTSDYTLFSHITGNSRRFVYWVKEQCVAGGISASYAGPAYATTASDPINIRDLMLEELGYEDGIFPVRAVNELPVLPDALYPIACAVFLRPDGPLYWNIANEWVAKIEAAFISGQLTDDQLAEISAAKIAGQIQSVQISDSAISSPKIAAGAITAAKIAAGEVTADKIAAKSLTADQIAAEAITASELAAGSVIAGKIATGAIVAGDGVIGNLAITTAHIGNASITSAKIESLAADKITAGTIKAGMSITAPTIKGGVVNLGSYTGYAWPPAGSYGAHLSASGLLVGNFYNGTYFQITNNGNVYAPGLSIVNGNATFSGDLAAESVTAADIYGLARINGNRLNVVAGGGIVVPKYGENTVYHNLGRYVVVSFYSAGNLFVLLSSYTGTSFTFNNQSNVAHTVYYAYM